MVIIRIQPLAGELSKFVVSSNDSSDEGEEDIIQTERVPGRIVQTSEQGHRDSRSPSNYHVHLQYTNTGCSNSPRETTRAPPRLLPACDLELRSSV